MPRPGLLFREDWKEPPAKTTKRPGASRFPGAGKFFFNRPISAEANSNPNLDLSWYVPAGHVALVREGRTNPIHVWTGDCNSPCAVAFRDKRYFANLTGPARIRFNSKMEGFHHIRPIVKLADGTWWVGDQTTGTRADFLVSEISFGRLHWFKLDIKRLVTVGTLVDKIDLSKVDEIDFIDLKPGSGHGPGGFSDVAQIEVYAHGVPRE